MTSTRHTDRDLLAIYLDDHVAGATVGVRRVARMARAYAGTPVGAVLGPLADELRDERAFLLVTTERLGLRASRTKILLAAAAERIGRLAPNGRLSRSSPLSALLEVELLRSAVMGKQSGWRSLAQLPADVDVDRARLAELDRQARRQVDDLTALLDRLRPAVLTRPSAAAPPAPPQDPSPLR
ncbi:hypothetical protein [Cellulosimicrobium sp. SH8]|uniref:hypothetical protein n=1 Tax=Cellulosimicrobium sp. SH8 TaxID=2952936 RepID=UPI0021F35A43|nr:hypothetical protein [Cellulosimicrobium sp. SH8]